MKKKETSYCESHKSEFISKIGCDKCMDELDEGSMILFEKDGTLDIRPKEKKEYISFPSPTEEESLKHILKLDIML